MRLRRYCNGNKCIADLRGVPFAGCAGHRFHLAACNILENYENTLSFSNALMSKLKGLLLGAKLWKITHFVPCTRNHTRRSSTFEMLVRYFELKDMLLQLESGEVAWLCLSSAVNRRDKHFLDVFRDLESVIRTLQKSVSTLADVWGLFDGHWHPSFDRGSPVINSDDCLQPAVWVYSCENSARKRSFVKPWEV